MTFESSIEMLVVIFALLFAVYLVYAASKPNIRRSVMEKFASKHKEDTIVRRVLHIIFTMRFLVAWLFVALFSVFGLALNLYENSRNPSPVVIRFGFVISMLIALTGLYLLWSAFKKRQD